MAVRRARRADARATAVMHHPHGKEHSGKAKFINNGWRNHWSSALAPTMILPRASRTGFSRMVHRCAFDHSFTEDSAPSRGRKRTVAWPAVCRTAASAASAKAVATPWARRTSCMAKCRTSTNSCSSRSSETVETDSSFGPSSSASANQCCAISFFTIREAAALRSVLICSLEYQPRSAMGEGRICSGGMPRSVGFLPQSAVLRSGAAGEMSEVAGSRSRRSIAQAIFCSEI
mmetsp:Transcript_15333/g.51588  ORF Transcript_15333/g.51588 Transcript_15333/m.51588 type:complete len:232 (+) Transcript_15333:936-1631(+)